MPRPASETLSKRALDIQAVVLDVDGVLTDGGIGYGSGHGEIKFFNVRDGHAMKMAMRAGLKVGILSGRASAANDRRVEELGLDFAYQGATVKSEAFDRLLAEQKLSQEQCMYVGDDLIDIPVLRRAGVSVAVADAAPELFEFCDFHTAAPGGRGAVREALEWLLKEQGKWSGLLKRYLE